MDRSRYRGALLGLAVGDALGAPVEFQPPGTFEPVTDMRGGGTFGLEAGQWTDDTSMALCLAESLVEKRGFDPVDQLERYLRWYREGYLSSTGECFDIGGSTRAALARFERTGEPFPGDRDVEGKGNGTIMKLAPVPLAFARDPNAAVRHAAESARTTHGSREAIDAARYFGGLLVGAVGGAGKDELVGDAPYSPAPEIWAREPLHDDVEGVAAGTFRDKRPGEIVGAGHVVGALEAGLWAFHSTDSFEEGVLAAVNLGGDTDTIGAICGQLAGAHYGVDAIPGRWLEPLAMRRRIVELADGLHTLAG